MKKKLIAEFIGTFLLVFIGTGAIVISYITDELTHFHISLLFGLIVTILILSFSHLSGAHFNPAVTVGIYLRKEIPSKEACFYIISQVFGGIVASATLLLLFGNTANLGSTIPYGQWYQSFILEFILTFMLMIVILSVTFYTKIGYKLLPAIIIGATVFVGALFGGPISGASMNPSRSIGPALISGNLQYLWIYIIATILGAICAIYTVKFLKK